jgi:hypothetical protein
MGQDWLIGTLVIGGLIGFVAMILGVANADRKAKRAIAEGKEPGFSWAWAILSIFLLARGIDLFIKECIYEKHKDDGTLANFIWQGVAILFLAAGIATFTNHIRWFLYTHRNRK